MLTNPFACGSASHFSRRQLLQSTAAVGGISWLTTLSEKLARSAENQSKGAPAYSLIVVWLEGGPSQLETFDPHPGTKIGGDTKAIDTSAKGVQLSSFLPRLAEQMHHVSLVRSLMSREGDHERATYNTKTGYRPDPTLVHPSLGAVLCHQTTDNLEIPRHVSILPGQWPARGGYLGDQYDAFKTFDPVGPIPDVVKTVSPGRFDARLKDLDTVESTFAKRRWKKLDQDRTLHRTSIEAARKMMSSDQLKAFDVSTASDSVRKEFGDTSFGRACLAAVQLIEVGVRCVEVSLGSWDTHANNHQFCEGLCNTLDPAVASLLKVLAERKLLEKTVVLIGGEFGRTPTINGAGGRDHWPHGFSMALAGGGIRGGQVVGQTNPEPKLEENKWSADVVNPRNIEDIHATIYTALGIDFKQELETPIGRPMAIGQGKVIEELVG